MLDGIMRKVMVPPLDRMASRLARRGLSANAVTIAGCVAAVLMTGAIALGWLGVALLLLVVSRVADGLDGAIARGSGVSGFGGFLDIFCDFVFYAGLPLGFALFSPATNGLPAAVLLASFYLNAASFLGFAILAERRGMTTEVRGPKSLYFTTGLAEGTETILAFVAMLLWPERFALIAYVFAALCLVTCLARVGLAARTFR